MQYFNQEKLLLIKQIIDTGLINNKGIYYIIFSLLKEDLIDLIDFKIPYTVIKERIETELNISLNYKTFIKWINIIKHKDNFESKEKIVNSNIKKKKEEINEDNEETFDNQKDLSLMSEKELKKRLLLMPLSERRNSPEMIELKRREELNKKV
jgi:hypothetical protein